MATSALQRYTPDSIDHLWEDSEKFWAMFRVERALLRAQTTLESSRVPSGLDLEALDGIEREDVDVAAIRRREEETKHETAAFVDWVEDQLPDEASRWVHFAVTSSDVLDTADSLRLREWFRHMREAYDELAEGLDDRMAEAGELRIMARTHGEPARPQPLRAVFERWKSQLDSTFQNLEEALDAVARAMISGPVGRFSQMASDAQRIVADELGIPPVEEPTSQIIPRHRHAAFVHAAANYTAVVEKIATDLRLYHGRGEIMEGFAEGQKGSSSMPHKQNPIRCENLCGLARQVRSAVTPALENVSLWHERDMSHSSVERFQLPQVTTLTLFATGRLRRVLVGLVVDEAECERRIRENDEWQVRGEMMEAIDEGLSREEAYRRAQREAFDE